MDNDNNIIKKILDNKSDYTELRISDEHIMHFRKNESEYLKLYGYNDYISLIASAMTKNEYIDSIYIDSINSSPSYKYPMFKLLFAKMFTSIYVSNHSLDVMKYLNAHEHKVTKLKLSSIGHFSGFFCKILENCKSLESLDIQCDLFDEKSLDKIFETINKTNIIQLIVSFCSYLRNLFEEYNMFISKNKSLKSLHITHKFLCITNDKLFSNISNNYTLLDVTVNGKCDDQITSITNRNKKYIMTILLCMNKKIIPRCVFKSMILVHII